MTRNINELKQLAANNGGINFNVGDIELSLIQNIEISGDAERITVGEANLTQIARTSEEIHQMMTAFCEQLCRGKYEKISVTTLRGYVYQFMHAYLGYTDLEAAKIILNTENRPKFEDVITKALDKYLEKLQDNREKAAERSFKTYNWEIPETRDYNENSHNVRNDFSTHAMQPYISKKGKSEPETRFESYLESNKTNIEWWYKNGDEGKQHFAITYNRKDGSKHLFYPDFIVKMNSGKVYLFDTKTKKSDENAPAKHNALIDYIHEENNHGKNLAGGILIEINGVWKYCTHKIDNTENYRGWTSLNL